MGINKHTPQAGADRTLRYDGRPARCSNTEVEVSQSHRPQTQTHGTDSGFNDAIHRWTEQLLQSTDQVGHEIDALTLHWIRLLRIAPHGQSSESNE